MRPWVIPAVIAALACAGAIAFLSSFERLPQREWVGPSGEARRNPFLAAARLAERLGLPAHFVRAVPQLDRLEARAALLLPRNRQVLDRRRLRQLLGWVEDGGHLIAEAELVGVSDPLLDALNVRRKRSEHPSGIMPLDVPGAARPLRVTFLDRFALDVPDDRVQLRLGAPHAAKLVSIERGRGTVTVVSSLAFAQNEHIGAEDNAEFLWTLLQLSPASGLEVYLHPERLSLWAFLVEHATPALVATAALVALWLWRVAPRFGPVVPDAPPARRRLLDHLRATGRYYWSNGLRARLVLAARDAALRRLARAQPEFVTASHAERIARLAALASISEAQAARFIASEGAARGAQFIELAHIAQRVQVALNRGQE